MLTNELTNELTLFFFVQTTAGGLGVAQQVYVGGVLAVKFTEDSITPLTGAVVVSPVFSINTVALGID